jgi:hypothetical protein
MMVTETLWPLVLGVADARLSFSNRKDHVFASGVLGK